MTKSPTLNFKIPGSESILNYKWDKTGQLIEISCNGTVYLEQRNGTRVIGESLATMNEVVLSNKLLKHVTTPNDSWTEEFIWHNLEKQGNALSWSYYDNLKIWLEDCYMLCRAEKLRHFLFDFIQWIEKNFLRRKAYE